MPSLDDLPVELLTRILGYCGLASLVHLSQMNKALRASATEAQFTRACMISGFTRFDAVTGISLGRDDCIEDDEEGGDVIVPAPESWKHLASALVFHAGTCPLPDCKIVLCAGEFIFLCVPFCLEPRSSQCQRRLSKFSLKPRSSQRRRFRPSSSP